MFRIREKADDMIERVDSQLYRAKSLGWNQVAYNCWALRGLKGEKIFHLFSIVELAFISLAACCAGMNDGFL